MPDDSTSDRSRSKDHPSVNSHLIEDHKTEATVQIPSPIFWARGKEKKGHTGVKVKYKEKDENYVQWLLDGAQAMYEMCDAFCRATDFIYIIGSYFSPGINLVRDDDYKNIYQNYKTIIDKVKIQNRKKGVNEDRVPLISLLTVMAEEGVKVRIITFHPDFAQEGIGGPYGGPDALKIVRNWSSKIDIRMAMWGGTKEGHEFGAHHQKSAVVATKDGLIGFCGGVDFAFARWAKPSHHLTLENRYPVVILPGIMGSEMKKGSEVVWPSLSAKNLKQVAENEDGRDAEDGITVGNIIGDFHGAGYDSLLGFLKQNGYPEGDLLFTLPYDWRKDLKLASDALAAKINDILNKKGASKVIIVAHSMGGLVARYFAMGGHADKIRRLIQLGTPNHGSPKSFMMIKFGKEGPIPWFVPWGPSVKEYKSVTANMQGVYQLLPDEKYFSLYKSGPGVIDEAGKRYGIPSQSYIRNTDTVEGGIFERGRQYPNPTEVYLRENSGLPNRALVSKAMDTFSTLGDVSHCDDTHVFVGYGLHTIGRVEVGPSDTPGPITQPLSGDGTVPMKSVLYLTDVLDKMGTNVHFQAGVEHGTLVQDTDVQKLLLAIMEDARIGGDSLDIPTRVDYALRLEKQNGYIDPSKVLGEWTGGEYAKKASQVLWHDVHAKVVGPAAYDLADNFLERYKFAESPLNDTSDYQTKLQLKAIEDEIAPHANKSGNSGLLSNDKPSIEGYSKGKVFAQIVRSYYPSDDYGIWDSYRSLFSDASSNIYIESQYAFEDDDLVKALIGNIQRHKERKEGELKVIIVAPLMPDSYDGKIIKNLGKLIQASATASGDYGTATVAAFSLLSDIGQRRVPIYVHAKIAVVDDEWATVGSANLDAMGMGGKGGGWFSFGSSEIGILVHGRDQGLALRNKVAEEHLGSSPPQGFDSLFKSFIQSAEGNGTPKDSGPLKSGQLVFHRVYDESKPKIPHPTG